MEIRLSKAFPFLRRNYVPPTTPKVKFIECISLSISLVDLPTVSSDIVKSKQKAKAARKNTFVAT